MLKMAYMEEELKRNNEKIIETYSKNKVLLVWSWIFGILFFWALFIPDRKSVV